MAALELLGLELPVTGADRRTTEGRRWKALGGQTHRHAYRTRVVLEVEAGPMPLERARDWRQVLETAATWEPQASTDWRGASMQITGSAVVSGTSLVVASGAGNSVTWALGLEAPWVLCVQDNIGRWVVPSSGTVYRSGVTTGAPAFLTVDGAGAVTFASGTYRAAALVQGALSDDYRRELSAVTGAFAMGDGAAALMSTGDVGLGLANVTMGELTVGGGYLATFPLALEAIR